MENEKHEIQMRANEEQRTRNGEREVTNEEREIGRTNFGQQETRLTIFGEWNWGKCHCIYFWATLVCIGLIECRSKR